MDQTSRWNADPDLRVSDADRDAVVTELAGHFQQGRLDQAEFDERMARALAARTGRDLGGLLADLPPARDQSVIARPGVRFPRPLLALALLAVAILIAGAAARGWVLWPLWWLLPVMLVRFGWWHRGWRGRGI